MYTFSFVSQLYMPPIGLRVTKKTMINFSLHFLFCGWCLIVLDENALLFSAALVSSTDFCGEIPWFCPTCIIFHKADQCLSQKNFPECKSPYMGWWAVLLGRPLKFSVKRINDEGLLRGFYVIRHFISTFNEYVKR